MNYTQSILAEIFASTPPPYRSVKWKVMPDPDGDPCLMLVLYLENFAEHSQSQQSSIGEWAGVLITKIRQAGMPCYLMRVKEDSV